MSRTNKLFCCYCEKRTREDYMTRVPIRKDLRQRWTNALGHKFAETCGNFKQPKLCLSHFEDVKNGVRRTFAIPKPLPFHNTNLGEKIKKFKEGDIEDNNNSSETLDKMEIEDDDESVVDQQESFSDFEKNIMTDVETELKNEEPIVLDKYDETILEVIEKFRYVEQKDKKQRKYASWTPKMDCRYCGVQHPTKKTCTQVPQNRERFLEWVDILGPEFAENCAKHSLNFICLSHFDIISNGKRLTYALPIPFPWKMDIEDEENEEDVGGDILNVVD